MPRWSLNYHLGAPDHPRSVEAEFHDLLGEGITVAHEFVRKISNGAGTLRDAVLLVDQEHSEDPLAGDPTIPLWITYVPYDPDDDPDKGVPATPRREAFQLPARLFETRVSAEGTASYSSPSLGYLQLAIRRRMADGREGTILRVDHEGPAD